MSFRGSLHDADSSGFRSALNDGAAGADAAWKERTTSRRPATLRRGGPRSSPAAVLVPDRRTGRNPGSSLPSAARLAPPCRPDRLSPGGPSIPRTTANRCGWGARSRGTSPAASRSDHRLHRLTLTAPSPAYELRRSSAWCRGPAVREFTRCRGRLGLLGATALLPSTANFSSSRFDWQGQERHYVEITWTGIGLVGRPRR